MSEIFYRLKFFGNLISLTLVQQSELTFSEDAILGRIHNGFAKWIESIMELLADSCVLSLRPVVNIPKARWALRNFWRSHLNLWHIKANTSHIVVVLFLNSVIFCSSFCCLSASFTSQLEICFSKSAFLQLYSSSVIFPSDNWLWSSVRSVVDKLTPQHKDCSLFNGRGRRLANTDGGWRWRRLGMGWVGWVS